MVSTQLNNLNVKEDEGIWQKWGGGEREKGKGKGRINEKVDLKFKFVENAWRNFGIKFKIKAAIFDK